MYFTMVKFKYFYKSDNDIMTCKGKQCLICRGKNTVNMSSENIKVHLTSKILIKTKNVNLK